jgi:hypothetical protein
VITATPVATFALSASSSSVNSDNQTSTTITLTALNATNAAVSGATVTLSTDTGILSAGTATTDATGKASFTFTSGTASKTNRTATITVSSGTATGQMPIQIVGSTVTAVSSSVSIADNGTSPATLTVTAKDSSGNAVPGAAVTFAKTAGAGNVTLTPSSGTTNSSGVLTTQVAGALAGSTTVTASALGATATTTYTVTPTAATFAVTKTTNGTVVTLSPSLVAMKIGDLLVVEVSAPSSASVNFVTTQGLWQGGTNIRTVAVAGGIATATLTTTQAGVANIQVSDAANPAINASFSVAMTSAAPFKITLQASPTVVAKSIGTTTGASVLVAHVTDSGGNPVGDAPVAFSIVNPTGGGESVSPVVVLSASTPSTNLALGDARASFTAGSLSSGSNGVQIRAQVLGQAVMTEAVGVDLTPSGNDAAIVIGGTAGSIAFGKATDLSTTAGNTAYVMAMSVLVADSSGNPAPAGTVVNLSAWPVAWSTGIFCAEQQDDGINSGTFRNEDVNENLSLDTGEDGKRVYYGPFGGSIGSLPAGTVATNEANSKKDGLITPVNSAGGTVPASITTDASGLATFSLTYGKNSAIWTVTRIRAATAVQGTEAVSEIIFRLPALKVDVDPDCKLVNPYAF